MTLLTNPNFIDQIIRAVGAEGRIDTSDISTLSLFVEMELRSLTQAAIRFMSKDRRDAIQLCDVMDATKQLGHNDLVVESTCRYSYQSSRTADRVYTAQELLQEQMETLLSIPPRAPKLASRWIFIKGKIPTINENIKLKSLSQLLNKEQEVEERRKLINIIKDDPYSLLSKEQIQYFEVMCAAIAQNVNPQGTFTVDGDLNNLVPFFLKFLGQGDLNDTGVCFLLKLIDNKYVWKGIEFYLKKMLSLLLAYRGHHSFSVGAKIAQLVDRFSDKYPLLRDIFINYKDKSYSTILKMIPFELYLGIPLEIDDQILQQCKVDSENDDRLAIKCMQALLSYSSQLKIFREFLMKKMNTYVYWHPCAELKNDPYLRMF